MGSSRPQDKAPQRRAKVTEIALTTPIRELTAKTLVEFPHDVAILARTQEPGGSVRVTLHCDNGKTWTAPALTPGRSVGEVVATLRGYAPSRIFRLPPGTFDRTKVTTAAQYSYTALMIGLAVACVCAAIVTNDPLFMFIAPLLGSASAIPVAPGHRVRFAIRNQVYEFTDLLAKTPIGEDPQTIVDQVKHDYGQLLSDIAYRIEYPALFDAREKLTEQLTLALFEWDAAYAGRTRQDSAALAARIRSSFDAARAHAERIGLDHYPEDARPTAERALGTARIATNPSATEAEREEAQRRTIALLDSLLLYYLPTAAQARQALGGGQQLQLPGRYE